jgi:succinate dehydrogenase / fumarate reductase flavoprotein subunit
MRQVDSGQVKIYPRREMLDLVVINGQARGIITRNLITGEIETYAGEAVLLATGGYSNIYYLSTNAVNCNATAIWRCYKRGALFGDPCFAQIHPTCIPQSGDYQAKLVLMSESLRNDGRIWVPKKKGDKRKPDQIPEAERDYYLERRYPAFGNLVPRDIASRASKQVCDDGYGVGDTAKAVYLDFTEAFQRIGVQTITERYGNLFEMYENLTGEDPYKVPMRIYPAPHYTMGGLWVDYNLMSTIPGLHVLGEANFSDHGANRLGASALMQGLADGYFVIPYTLAHYLAGTKLPSVSEEHQAFKDMSAEVKAGVEKILSIKGNKTVREFHRELGMIMWNDVGMSRNRKGLEQAIKDIAKLRSEFWQNLRVLGESKDLNKNLEFAGRLADYLELGELMALDALDREESCGGHFREEYQTQEGDAKRNDEQFSYVAAWEYAGKDKPPILHKEPLTFEYVKESQRSYK